MTTGRPLKLGIILPEGENDMGGVTARWSDFLTMGRRAEELGVDSLWFVDHLLYRDGATTEGTQGVWECWSMLSALAAVTERVELGPLVSCTSYRNPALLAKIADTVDEISGGRLIMALGAGWHEPEYHAFGFPYDHRVSRFEEAFTIVRTLLREGAIDFEGQYYSARDCELRPRGPRPNGPPIMLGTTGPRMLRLTAQHADSWNVWLCSSDSAPTAYPPIRAAVDAACAEVGRDPATLERTVSVMVDLAGTHEVPASMGPATAKPLTGTPIEIAASLRQYADMGVAHVQVYLVPNTLETLEAFGEVLAALDG